MARSETDREDLIRDATALTRRIELQMSDATEPIVAGVRDSGALSIYFGADPVYHFDAQGRLRRAFVAGELYRTQRGTLARLRRFRTESETQLQRHDLTSEELDEFHESTISRLRSLRQSLAGDGLRVQRQHPSDEPVWDDVVAAVVLVLETMTSETWLAPPVKGKR